MATQVGAPRKRHVSERYRNELTLPERWTNAKSALVGYLTGKGRTSVSIAREMGDGTIDASVRAMWKKWRLPNYVEGRAHHGIVPVFLTSRELDLLKWRADKLGLPPAEWLRQVLTCAIADDLYSATTNGRFDARRVPA